MASIEPDRAALEIVHKNLMTPMPLDEMLKEKSLAIILKILAVKHMQRRDKFDAKKIQANDCETHTD